MVCHITGRECQSCGCCQARSDGSAVGGVVVGMFLLAVLAAACSSPSQTRQLPPPNPYPPLPPRKYRNWNDH
jgi:hypothetical protein